MCVESSNLGSTMLDSSRSHAWASSLCINKQCNKLRIYSADYHYGSSFTSFSLAIIQTLVEIIVSAIMQNFINFILVLV